MALMEIFHKTPEQPPGQSAQGPDDQDSPATDPKLYPAPEDELGIDVKFD
jgi:hypothetical protein